MLDRRFLKIEERHVGIGHFYHKKWYNETYRLGIFREGIVPDDNFHKDRCC
jgi:hypothetical protein